MKRKWLRSVLMFSITLALILPVGFVSAATGTELYYDDGMMNSAISAGSNDGYFAVRFTPLTTPVTVTQLSFYAAYPSSATNGGARVIIFNSDKDLLYAGDLFYSWMTGWNDIDLSSETIPTIYGDFYAGFEMPGTGEPDFGADNTAPIDGRSYLGFDRLIYSPTTTSDYMIRATVVPAATAVANDNFPGLAISGTSGTATENNTEASVELDEPYHGYGSGEHTLWWSWTAPENGTAVFNTYGSSDSYADALDTILAVYTGDALTDLALVAKNDDFDEYDKRQSQVAFKAVAGTTYRIVADAYDAAAVGDVVLNWSYVTPQTGDDFPGTAISDASGQSTSGNVYATRESGEPLHSGSEYYEGQSSLWWTWTAPADGPYLFDLSGSTCLHDWGYDYTTSVIAIYTGNSFADLELAAASTDFSQTASVVLNAVAGTTYRIAVDGLDSAYWSLGSVVLNWQQLSAPQFTSVNQASFAFLAYNTFTLTASGTPAPVISLTSGYLPAGIFYDQATATIYGNAQSTGTFLLTFTADNGIDPAAVQSFTLTVNQPPSITSLNSTTFKEGTAGTFTVTATGYPLPQITLTSGTLPAGLSFDPDTATFSGTPAAGTAGSYPLTFTAANGIAPAATQNFTLHVIREMAPQITAQPENTAVLAGEPATFTVDYTAFPEPTFQWQTSRNGRRWSDIAGATTASYTVTKTRLNMDGFQYRVLLYNGIGNTVVSDTATLTVLDELLTTADIRVVMPDGTYDAATGCITWAITVFNDGPESADAVVLTNSLAKGTGFSAIDLSSITGATCKVRGTTIDINIGTLSSGNSVSLTITAAVSRATSPVENKVIASSGSYDPDLTNNTVQATCSW